MKQGFRSRSFRFGTMAVVTAAALAGCQRPQTGWDDISPTPEAQPYEGDLELLLTTRLQNRISEYGHRTLGSRIEELPAGLDWATYIAWRDRNDDGMRRVVDRIPEPDAPVFIAEFDRAGRTLWLIGRPDDDGRHVIVLTALTAPRGE